VAILFYCIKGVEVANMNGKSVCVVWWSACVLWLRIKTKLMMIMEDV